ncbi:MAG: sulfotransferase family protein [Smithellaceae bacterium]
MQKCIIVLGMHRSGTSAVSGFLNKLGIPLGSKLLIPNEYNEKGYFENSYIVDANERILQTLGASWDDQFLLREEWWKQPQVMPCREAVKKIIIQEFAADEIFCIKDPRISILLPLWISVLEEMKIDIFFIIPLRHPLEVAESLKTRDGFSIQKGLLLWMNSMISIEYFSRPYKRSFAIFEDFLKISDADMHRIFDKLYISFPTTKSRIDTVTNDFLDLKLKHHHINDLVVDDVMLSLIERFNILLFNLGNNQKPDENVLTDIDEIRSEYKRLSSTFYNRDIKDAISSANKELADLRDQISNFTQTVSDANKELDHLREQISQIRHILAEREAVIKEMLSATSWRLTRPLRTLKTTFFNKSAKQ